MRWLLIAVLITACATNKPGVYRVPAVADVQAAPQTVLATARQWLGEHGFVVTGGSESHVTATSDLRTVEGRTMDAWSGMESDTLAFDCGGPPAGGRGYVTEAVVSVTVEPGSVQGACVVRVNMQPRQATWGLHQCVSTGLVERSIMEAIGATPRP